MTEYINTFMERYSKEFDFYSNLSKKVEEHLRIQLHSSGVRAIVSSRAKSPTRLKDKIIDRNGGKPYSSVENIYNDIVDLAGVRVALYFPGDIPKVEEIILSEFEIEGKPKDFPENKKKNKTPSNYEKTFSGYAAKHFRVKMKGSDRYANNYPVEIQVASVLMHAWSEVEHDLVYKPLQGNLSQEELMILDEINGLVLNGNLALQRLQAAGLKRTESDNYEFKNHYDLALFFISCLQEENIDSINFNEIFKLLKLMNKTIRNELADVVSWIKGNPLIKEKSASTNGVRRRKRDPVSQLHDYIFEAIVNVFPDDSITILEKLLNDTGRELEITDITKISLFKAIKSHCFSSENFNFVRNIVHDYEINSDFIYETKEESLHNTKSQKNVSFSKSDKEVISFFDEFLELKNKLTPKTFSKRYLDDLVAKNDFIFSFTLKNQSGNS